MKNTQTSDQKKLASDCSWPEPAAQVICDRMTATDPKQPVTFLPLWYPSESIVRIIAVLFLYSIFCSTSLAHDFVHPHSCIKPTYTIDYEADDQLAQLDNEITSYQECLREFAKFQLGQFKAHSDASSAALEDLRAIADDIVEHAPEELIKKWQTEIEESESE